MTVPYIYVTFGASVVAGSLTWCGFPLAEFRWPTR